VCVLCLCCVCVCVCVLVCVVFVFVFVFVYVYLCVCMCMCKYYPAFFGFGENYFLVFFVSSPSSKYPLVLYYIFIYDDGQKLIFKAYSYYLDVVIITKHIRS